MTLAVLPELRVKIGLKGTITLTQKFIDGMLEYLKYWDGPVTACMQPTEERSWNLDEVEIDRARLPFKVEVISFDHPGLGRVLAEAKVILGSVSYQQNQLSSLCRSIGVPCVYVSEYCLRVPIVHMNRRNKTIINSDLIVDDLPGLSVSKERQDGTINDRVANDRTIVARADDHVEDGLIYRNASLSQDLWYHQIAHTHHLSGCSNDRPAADRVQPLEPRHARLAINDLEPLRIQVQAMIVGHAVLIKNVKDSLIQAAKGRLLKNDVAEVRGHHEAIFRVHRKEIAEEQPSPRLRVNPVGHGETVKFLKVRSMPTRQDLGKEFQPQDPQVKLVVEQFRVPAHFPDIGAGNECDSFCDRQGAELGVLRVEKNHNVRFFSRAEAAGRLRKSEVIFELTIGCIRQNQVLHFVLLSVLEGN